ncbi:hypothetical protein R4K54_07240, partial [Brachyspira murdochii]
EKNNANYNTVMLEQNLKTFKEISSLRKGHKDIEEEMHQTYENINNKINTHIEDQNTKYDAFIKTINDILEKNNIKYEELADDLNNRFNLSIDEQKKYFNRENQDTDSRYEAFIKNINEILENNYLKYEELANTVNAKLESNKAQDYSKGLNRVNYNNNQNEKLVNYIENRLNEESSKNDKRIKKIEDNQSKNNKEIKEVNKKIGNVAIVSVSLFVVIIIVFLAYQLL